MISTELDNRFRAAAAEAGLLDVAYDVVDTPIGQLLVAATDAGLCRISYDPEPERFVEGLARTLGTRVLRSARPVDETRRQLDEYFDRHRTEFDLDVAFLQLRPHVLPPTRIAEHLFRSKVSVNGETSPLHSKCLYMRLALITAWAGFAAGILFALAFAAWPRSFFAQTCIICFGFDFDVTPRFLAVILIAFTLMNGAIYGLFGFAAGFITSKVRTRA